MKNVVLIFLLAYLSKEPIEKLVFLKFLLNNTQNLEPKITEQKLEKNGKATSFLNEINFN